MSFGALVLRNFGTACVATQVDKLSELLREVQMLRVTREVQAVISAAPGGSAAGGGAPAFHPASQHLQTLENLMKHNDRSLLSCCVDSKP